MKTDKLKSKLKNLQEAFVTPVWEKTRSQYMLLSESHRMILICFGILLGLSLIYGFIWNPLKNWESDWEQNFEIQRESYLWIEKNAPIAKIIGERNRMNTAQDLFSLCLQSGRRLGIIFSKVSPESRKEVSVSSKKVSYQKLLSWFSLLSKEKVDVQEVNIKQLEGEEGKVSFVAKLSR